MALVEMEHGTCVIGLSLGHGNQLWLIYSAENDPQQHIDDINRLKSALTTVGLYSKFAFVHDSKFGKVSARDYPMNDVVFISVENASDLTNEDTMGTVVDAALDKFGLYKDDEVAREPLRQGAIGSASDWMSSAEYREHMTSMDSDSEILKNRQDILEKVRDEMWNNWNSLLVRIVRWP